MQFRRALLLAMAALFMTPMGAQGKEIAVIVGKTHPLTRSSPVELADIYLGNKEVVGKVRLKPIDQKEGQSIHSAFLKKVLRMSHEDYVEHWNRRLFREGGTPPLLKGDPGEVIRAVEEKDGAVGYIWASDLDDSANVRIILTINVPD